MVDVNSLLAPISDDKPCGTYLKLDRSAYRGLRNAYNSAQSSFRQLIETPDASNNQELLELNDTHWAELRSQTQTALEKQTKDLEILGWYVTSQLFTRAPFSNFSLSVDALSQLIEQYWSDLNPLLPEEKRKGSDDNAIAQEVAEFRLKPLLQLVGESPDSTAIFMPLQMLHLIGEITFSEYLIAERSGGLADIKQTALGQFSSEVNETLEHLSQAYRHFSLAEKSIAEQCQKLAITPVSFKFVKGNIADFINAIKFLVGEKFTVWPLDANFEPVTTTTEVASNTSSDTSARETSPSRTSELTEPQQETPIDRQNVTSAENNPAPVVNQGQPQPAYTAQEISGRDQAFQELRKISDYFKQAEPHSPISFLLERAIRWGYLSLPELLEEMVGRDTQMLQHINQLTGMDNLEQTELSTAHVHSRPNTGSSTLGASSGGNNQNSAPTAPDSAANNTTSVTQTNTEPQPSQDSGSVTAFEW
ncbi:type VI secretion system ImpA family N-terminal domain-containing protein [uncultured Vibrio sp.]|uniref:type VI secretion system protein TssA n=1 Tax=uncultured Vibrio sp. TaxID=114054 RepID=UPI00091BB5B1|nr:type VI secretion system ImpA family N-terminal domain-containing protein [uncultured Vibrio sp.]OIQ26226.1 MAG: type VI secretion protein [Vibrio sp. MedPE-SWchi]